MDRLLSEEQAVALYRAAQAVAADPRYRSVRQLYVQIVEAATEALPIVFPNPASRLYYLLNTQELPDALREALEVVAAFFHSRSNRPEVPLDTIVRTLAELIAALSGVPIPPELAAEIEATVMVQPEQLPLPDQFPLLDVRVEAEGEPATGGWMIRARSPLTGSIQVLLTSPWDKNGPVLWKGATVRLSNLKRIPEQKRAYTTTETSAVVVEPDYMVDVSELTRAIYRSSFDLETLVLSWFENPLEFKPALIRGVIINECLDLLLLHPNWNDHHILQAALRQNAALFAGLPDDAIAAMVKSDIEQSAPTHLSTLRAVISYYRSNGTVITAEPTFLSARYGITGRLDLLIEYSQQPLRKDVVELKSGKPPGGIEAMETSWKTGRLALRFEHELQATAYNLLLDATFTRRTGASMILYSRLTDWRLALRNVDNTWRAKQRLLLFRNFLVAAHFRFAIRRLHLDYQIAAMVAATAPEFRAARILQIQRRWDKLTPAEQMYFQRAVEFLFRERWAALRGYSTRSVAASALWTTSLEEKRRGYFALTDLELTDIRSNDHRLLLQFRRTDSKPIQLRDGDRVLLYPHTATSASPEQQQLLRGTLRRITPTTVRIELLNPITHPEWLQQWERWVIEEDLNLSLFNRWFANLALLLYATPKRRRIVLGLQSPAPATPELDLPSFDYLTDHQRELLRRCLASPDYFLVQGPPGSGKTSRFLRALVDFFVNHQQQRVLLLTYTHRAADEICQVLSTLKVPFLRLGTNASTEFPQATLSEQIQTVPPEALPGVVQSHPCIVSTVATLIGSPEYLLHSFDVAIVDEASQLLETHLAGILSAVPRFILIGDEKQLPAVVQQRPSRIPLDPELAEQHYASFHESLFSRLLRQAQQNGWHWCYGMLTEQGRMHVEIQQLVNALFYNHQLCPLHPRQSASHSPIFTALPPHPLFQLLQTRRVLFVPTPRGQRAKLNEVEAEWIGNFVNTVAHFDPDFNSDRIGVIAPFRAQIALIQHHFSPAVASMVTVDTVERFQGSERDIICLSLCLHSPQLLMHVQSLDADGAIDRKLNVALTRAREHLLIFGTPEVLETDPIYRQLLHMLREHDRIISDPSSLFNSLPQLLS